MPHPRELNTPNHPYYATQTHIRTLKPEDESKMWFYNNPFSTVNLIPVFFDGTDFLQRLAELDDAVDSQQVSGCVAFNTDALSQVIVGSPGDKVLIEVLGTGKLSLTLKNAAGTVIYKSLTTSNVDDGVDHVFVFSYDGVTGNGEMYLDGVDEEGIPSVETVGTVDLTAGDFAIGTALV